MTRQGDAARAAQPASSDGRAAPDTASDTASDTALPAGTPRPARAWPASLRAADACRTKGAGGQERGHRRHTNDFFFAEGLMNVSSQANLGLYILVACGHANIQYANIRSSCIHFLMPKFFAHEFQF